MTTPPHDPPPGPDEWPPSGQGGPPPGQGPPPPGQAGWPGPGQAGWPGPGQGGWAPPPTQSGSTGTIVGLTFAGIAVYSVLNTVLGFVVLILAANSGPSSTPVVAAGAAVLALIGLGGGVGLLFVRKPWATGAGLGLMIGWALWSIVSAGYCTGLNPTLYG